MHGVSTATGYAEFARKPGMLIAGAVISGVWLCFTAFLGASFIHSIFQVGLGQAEVIFFLIGALFVAAIYVGVVWFFVSIVQSLMGRPPALITNPSGIRIVRPCAPDLLIPWGDITEISRIKTRQLQYVTLKTTRPKRDYADGSTAARVFDFLFGQRDVRIDCRHLEIGLDSLHEALKEMRDRFGRGR